MTDQKRAAHRAELNWRAAPVIARLKAGLIPARKLADMRDACRRGVCPLCGMKGFRSIAVHANRMHALSGRQFRDILGFNFSESICSPEHARACADRARARGDRPYLYGKSRGPKQVSKAGRRVMRLNGLLGLPQIPAEVKRAIRRARAEAL